MANLLPELGSSLERAFCPVKCQFSVVLVDEANSVDIKRASEGDKAETHQFEKNRE